MLETSSNFRGLESPGVFTIVEMPFWRLLFLFLSLRQGFTMNPLVGLGLSL